MLWLVSLSPSLRIEGLKLVIKSSPAKYHVVIKKIKNWFNSPNHHLVFLHILLDSLVYSYPSGFITGITYTSYWFSRSLNKKIYIFFYCLKSQFTLIAQLKEQIIITKRIVKLTIFIWVKIEMFSANQKDLELNYINN